MTAVLVRLLTDDPSPVAIPGAVVEFYDLAAVFQTSGTTDSSGEVTVTLPDDDYDVLLYKVGVTILPKQPQRITVDTLLTNHFEVTGHVRDIPASIDPLRCTVSGYILGVDGKAAKHRLIFEPLMLLTVASNNIIAPYHRIEIPSDDTGYFEFELLRNTKYNAYFVFPQDLFRMQPGRLDVITPDSDSVLLDALLFPLPINLDFSADTISVTGPTPDSTITVDLTFSDGSTRTTLSTPWAGIALTNTDATVVEASLRDGGILLLRALSPGTATITTVRTVPDSVYFNPLPDYTTGSVVVTVT